MRQQEWIPEFNALGFCLRPQAAHYTMIYLLRRSDARAAKLISSFLETCQDDPESAVETLAHLKASNSAFQSIIDEDVMKAVITAAVEGSAADEVDMEEWGFGEPSYIFSPTLREPSDRPGRAPCIDFMHHFNTLRWTQEPGDRATGPLCRFYMRHAQGMSGMDDGHVSSGPILMQHRAAVYALLNTTALSMATSVSFVLASIFELCRNLAKRLEILRWHLTYFLLQLVFPDAKDLKKPLLKRLPTICSS
eukprot:symbB.v1.2.017426.t1/scaffold1359.1/size123592/11